MRLEAPYYDEIDAEDEGALSAEYPRLHTGGGAGDQRNAHNRAH